MAHLGDDNTQAGCRTHQGPQIREISGGSHGTTIVGDQNIHKVKVKNYPTGGDSGPAVEKGIFLLSPLIKVFENNPIDIDSRVFHGEFHSSVTGKRKVAVKITSHDEKHEREAKIHFSVPHHKNIVERIAADTFNFRGQPSIYIVMECCELNLQQYILSQKEKEIQFNAHKYLSFSHQIVTGVEFLHFNKIVVCDLKPSNILVAENGTVLKISDFGLSKTISPDRSRTKLTSPHAGTDGWRAPEVLKGAGTISTATDIFPLGLVLYYTWSYGGHPYGDEPYSWNHYIVKGENRDLRKMLIPNQSTAIPLLESMLQHDPAKRPSAKEVLRHEVFNSDNRSEKFTDMQLSYIIDNTLKCLKMKEAKNRSVDELTPLGVTVKRLSHLFKDACVENGLVLNHPGSSKINDINLQDVVNDAVKLFGKKDGETSKNVEGEDKLTPLGVTTEQLSGALKVASEKNDLLLKFGSRSGKVDNTKLLDVVDKAVKLVENKDLGSIMQSESEVHSVLPAGVTLEQLANAIELTLDKKKLHLAGNVEAKPDEINGFSEKNPADLMSSAWKENIMKQIVNESAPNEGLHTAPLCRCGCGVILMSPFKSSKPYLSPLVSKMRGNAVCPVEGKFVLCSDSTDPVIVLEELSNMASCKDGITLVLVCFMQAALPLCKALGGNFHDDFFRSRGVSGENLAKNIKNNLAVFTFRPYQDVTQDLAKITLNFDLSNDAAFATGVLSSDDTNDGPVNKLTFSHGGGGAWLMDYVNHDKVMGVIRMVLCTDDRVKCCCHHV